MSIGRLLLSEPELALMTSECCNMFVLHMLIHVCHIRSLITMHTLTHTHTHTHTHTRTPSHSHNLQTWIRGGQYW